MTTKTWKISIKLFSSIFILIAVKTILACAGGDEDTEGNISVFAPQIIQQPSKEPFFLSPHVYYSLEGFSIPDTYPTLTQRNTAEWVSYFGNRISETDIEWLIYSSSPNQLKTLQQSLSNKNIKTDTLNQVIVKAFRNRKNSKDILDYIILAKSAEKYFNPDYVSWEPLQYDSSAIHTLIPLCVERFKSATDPFLKQRYGFQATRALSVSGRYVECINFFDHTFNPTIAAASMYYRSLGYKARSLYKLQQYTVANYLYACLYDADPTLRYIAFQSFHPQEESDWTATLQLAKTTSEREALWELFCISTDPVRAIREIYAFNPQSNSLPLLLVRAVNIEEEQVLMNPKRGYDNFFYTDYTERKETGIDNGYTSTYIDSASQRSLMSIIGQVVTERKINKLPVWQLAGAYLQILKGDYKSSSSLLSALAIDKTDSLLMGQAAIIKGILYVRSLSSINTSAENEVYDHIIQIDKFNHPALRKENATRYIISQLSLLYENQHDRLKKELAYPLGQVYYSSSVRTQDMINFMKKTSHEPLEKYLLGKYPLSIKELYHIKAISYIYEYDFTSAINEYKNVNTDSLYNINANPFTIHIVDCHDCDEAAIKSNTYTPYSFAKKMAELKARGDSSKENETRAQNYLLYANGIYNMTWYGNSRTLHGTPVSRDDYNSVVYGKNEYLRKSNFFNCNEALLYYQKAFAVSNNKEFKAKCTWMSAKCELNNWLTTKPDTLSKDFIAGKYFREMKAGFTNTQYYKEVLNECGYFCSYITKSDSCKRNR